MNITLLKSSFMYFLAQLRRFIWYLSDIGGFLCATLTFPNSLSVLHRLVLQTLYTPALAIMAALVSKGFFFLTCRIFRLSHFETMLFPLSFLNLGQKLISFMAFLIVLGFLPNNTPIWQAWRPSASCLVINLHSSGRR